MCTAWPQVGPHNVVISTEHALYIYTANAEPVSQFEFNRLKE